MRDSLLIGQASVNARVPDFKHFEIVEVLDLLARTHSPNVKNCQHHE